MGDTWRSKTCFTLITLVSSLVISAVLWSALIARDSTPSSRPTALDSPQYARLHPERHAFRSASSITLDWCITTGWKRPDGVLKEVYLINGEFPGPTIEARSGDRLIINVENGLLNQSLSIHWHGLSMRGYNRMDGAAGVTQAPIEPGHTFTYDFVIDSGQHGTFWYHAHSGIQRGGGLYGGLIVHEPRRSSSKRSSALAHEYLLLAGDWYHRGAQDTLDFFSHPGAFGNEAVPDSLLVNGHGSYRCGDAVKSRPVDCVFRSLDTLPAFRFDASKETIARIVNVGSYAGLCFTIPGAVLEPISLDAGFPVNREVAKSVGTLYPGERVDLLLRPLAQAERADRHFTISMNTTAFKYSNSALTTNHDFPLTWMITNPPAPLQRKPHESIGLGELQSRDVQTFPREPNEKLVLYAITQKLAHLDNQPLGFINSSTWPTQSFSSQPLVDLPRPEWTADHFVPRIVSSDRESTWVDIVVNNLDEEGHPFHFHGNTFWVLSTYSSTINWGSYNPFEDADPPGGEYNMTHAVKKDTVYVPRRGYAVLRFRADNFGIWMFHCHVLWHQASGMAMAMEVALG